MNILCRTLVLSLFSLSVSAQTLDLLKTYELALQQDAQIRAADALRSADRETQSQALADLLPSIQANAESNDVRQESSSNFSNGTTQFDDEGFGVSARQPLFNWGRWMRYKQAQRIAARADTQYEVARQALILRVAERYLDVLNAQVGLDVAQAEHKAIERQLEQVNERFEVGLVPITDVHDAQARFDLAQATLIEAEDLLASSQEALREIILSRDFELTPLASDVPLSPPEPANIQSWVDVAAGGNLDLMLAKADVAIAKRGISAERAAHLPSIDLVGTHTYRDSGGGNLGSGFTTETDSIGVEINLSLFEGGKVLSLTREAAYRHQQSIEELHALLRETERTTRDAYRGVVTSTHRIRALKQAVVSNESALEANEVGLEVGTRTIVDVLDAQNNLSQAKLQLTEARHTYILNILKLKQTAGSLSVEDLKTVNGWLSAETATPD